MSTQPQPLQDGFLHPCQGRHPPQDFLAGSILYDGQRHTRKRLQEPLRRWGISHLALVLWVQTGEAGLILRQRPPKDTLHDRQHADAERQEVREALDLLVELDKQRRDMDAAFEAIEYAFDAVFIRRYRG
jgi:hypothetical protein